MPDTKEKEFKREPGLCVIRDDDQDWGGPAPEVKPKEKIKKIITTDEPMNWPFNRYRL